MTQEMQHQALYRRYRPQTPADVLGQDHVVRALTGAIREGRLHHAFLFCGPRGTGKTSTARILAKMVNCEKGPTPEPCGVCSQCVSIREGTHLDVVEIDAASHGGVEDARELREKAPTAPVQGREKVYIIDEAQRLSAPAFDALLKVFEEPPPGVRFVLATTEPQKMPVTIVGRCQRFDFRRLTMETLAAQLQSVATSEGVTLTESAAHSIARHAEGSSRDALSMLDQASVLGGANVDDDAVRALLGAPRGEVQHELADSIAVGDARGAFEIVNRLVQAGHDLRSVTAEALEHFRNLLLVKTAPGQEDLLDVSPDSYEALRTQAGKYTPSELSRVLSLLLAAQNDMRWTTSPRISLEVALVRATMPDTDPTPAGVVSRLERLERLANLAPGTSIPPAIDEGDGGAAEGSGEGLGARAVAEGSGEADVSGGGVGAKGKGSGGGVIARGVARKGQRDHTDAAPTSTAHAADAGSVDVSMLRRSWPSLIEHLGSTRQMILKAILESATVASYDGQTLELAFPMNAKFTLQKVEERQEDLQNGLNHLFGIRPDIVCVVREMTGKADGAATIEVPEEEESPDEAEALRRVQEMLGAQIAGGTPEAG